MLGVSNPVLAAGRSNNANFSLGFYTLGILLEYWYILELAALAPGNLVLSVVTNELATHAWPQALRSWALVVLGCRIYIAERFHW